MSEISKLDQNLIIKQIDAETVNVQITNKMENIMEVQCISCKLCKLSCNYHINIIQHL